MKGKSEDILEKGFSVDFFGKVAILFCVLAFVALLFYADGKEDSYFYCNLYPICYSSICGEYN